MPKPKHQMATQNKGTGFDPEAMRAPRGKNHLLVIAIDEYAHCPKLYNCVKDAREFIEVLTARYQFEPGNITTLYNIEATRPNIHTELKKLKRQVGPDDNLVIYFSGHGETEDKVGYWVPVDARPQREWEYFSTDEIKRRLDAINSFHTFVIVDACFSGSLFTSYKSISPGYETKRSRWGLAASHSRERALDGTPGENSPFATTLLGQLKNSQDNLSIQELAAAIIRRVEQATEGRQTPVFKPLAVKGDDEGQYVFHLKANEAADWKSCQEAGTVKAYQAFLLKYPEGMYTQAAQATLAELEEEAAWQNAQESNSILSYYQYNQRYPAGRHHAEALAAIERLEDEQSWRQAQRASSLSALLKYKEHFPKGQFAAEAEEQIRAILAAQKEPAAWQAAQKTDTIVGYEAFLQEYPQGPHASEARVMIEELERKAEEERIQKEEAARQQKLDEKKRLWRQEEWAREQQRKQKEEKRQGALERPRRQDTHSQSSTAQAKPEQASEAHQPGAAFNWKKWGAVAMGLLAIALVIWGISHWAAGGGNIPSENPTKNTTVINQDGQQGGEERKGFPTMPIGTETPEDKTYKTLIINGKTWMAENLNHEVANSWCYDDDPANCRKYGRLYTWQAALDACKALGNGWRLPTDEEWKSMANSFGGYEDIWKHRVIGDPKKSYEKLLEGENGKDGFAALLGGYRGSYSGYSSLGMDGIYWSGTEKDAEAAWNYIFGSKNGKLFRYIRGKEAFGISCRCIKGAPSNSTD